MKTSQPVTKPRSQLKEFAGMAIWITAIIAGTAVLHAWMTQDMGSPDKEKVVLPAPENLP